MIAHRRLQDLYARSPRLQSLPDSEQRLKSAREHYLGATRARVATAPTPLAR